jgi:hypothetical protein
MDCGQEEKVPKKSNFGIMPFNEAAKLDVGAVRQRTTTLLQLYNLGASLL